LDAGSLLDFGDLDPWPPRPAAARASAAAAVCDATGVRDPRPSLQGALDRLAPGGWLAALVDAGALAGEGGAGVRRWLATRGWVAATVSLPPGHDDREIAALLLRAGTGGGGPVLTVTPEAIVRDVVGHARYLAQARVRVWEHLSRPG
jgi:hypothetical protein